jgi:hypothetical protein
MANINAIILQINKVICDNIDELYKTKRGLLSQNILSQLRNLVEHISLKVYSNGQNIENTYHNLEEANAYIKTRGNLKFISRFHKLLQISASHYTLDEENSERLMLKYYEYLLKIKSFLKITYNLNVLENINLFPLKSDSILNEYYKKIATKIKLPKSSRIKSTYSDRYYIQKIKPFFIDNEIHYEVTFTIANDNVSKFDRIIAFTKFEISPNYAVKLSVSHDNIKIMGKDMPIQIIDEWEVSIRPCELSNFAKIFGIYTKLGGNVEYYELMKYLTSTNINLVEYVDFPENAYQYVKEQITERGKVFHFFEILDICREMSKINKPGINVIRYLLYSLNNRIIKKQFKSQPCYKLSDLNLEFGCIPFDQMPYNTSLKNHNPKLSDLFDCINSNDREHEIFARLIKNNTEIKGQLYTSKKDIKNFENIDDLILLYNSKLYYTHGNRRLEKLNDHIYIKGYEEDTFHIIEKLKELSSSGIENYSNSVKAWLQSSSYYIDCGEKKDALEQMFENSRIVLIYGSAGTGKSTMINHISNFFNDKRKIYLANTNPAVDNLKRKVKAANCAFKTITKFLLSRNSETTFDLLIIDECSTLSNSDMLAVLNKATFKLLVLVGDVFQIESILFGNWFNVAQSFVPKSSIFELTKPYRSTNPNLLNLWQKVRNIEDDILEHIIRNSYSVTLDESIFQRTDDDEIILCLNYDGLYGINNINRFLQNSNNNDPIQWGIQTYKKNDPILFNESDRFAPLIYNNLKGKIISIEKFDEKIRFDIEIDKVLNELDVSIYDFELIEANNDSSVIRFFVYKNTSTDEDDDSSSDAFVPFQVAYTVSIHKAQGLEYKSVKVVLTDEIEEMITHNIFYTAITRAKEKLKIYWTPETENKVIKGLEKKINSRDVSLLKSKFNL